MEVLRNIEVPTGNILIVRGDKGKLECLSIGDYGKEKNLKADFLGLSDEINGVAHGDLLPLTEKWVVTISTQYGCSSGCKFCDVPKVGPGVNATVADMIGQVKAALAVHPETTWTNRLNVHFARMGEPTWNTNVLKATGEMLKTIHQTHTIHPVVSTMMPRKNKHLSAFLNQWMWIKNVALSGEAGLQLSINSTDEEQRRDMFSGSALTLFEIGGVVKNLPKPKGRKITLNFALDDTYVIDPDVLLRFFPPDRYLAKITPMHMTNACVDNGMVTDGGYFRYYPYDEAEKNLKDAGYDVIVFVPSIEEDESKITCGNAILSDEANKNG